jgi:hypothetical protein
MANAREIRVDRIGFDVMAHVNGVEAKSVWSWFNGKIVHADERKI